MCSVSAVMDYGQKTWPDLMRQPYLPPIRIQPYPNPDSSDAARFELTLDPNDPIFGGNDTVFGTTNPQPLEGRLPSADEIREFLKLVEAAKRFDEQANQPHCEDPVKIKLLEAIEARLTALEAKVDAVLQPEQPMLIGSSIMPAQIVVGNDSVMLGEVVRQACAANVKGDAKRWNELEDTTRERYIFETVLKLRRAVEPLR